MGLRSITINKASEGDGIAVELFQILKDDAVRPLEVATRWQQRMEIVSASSGQNSGKPLADR